MKAANLLFLLQFLLVSTVLGQIEKGDALVDVEGFYERTKTATGSKFFPRNSLYVRYGHMVGDHLMAGLGVGYFHSKGNTYFEGEFLARSIEVDPFIRYYFMGKNKFMPFVFVNGAYTHYNYETEVQGAVYREGRIQVHAGMGLDYFLTPNIALEAEVGTLAFDHKNAIDNGDLFYARLGWKTFLADYTVEDIPLPDRFLKKGNFSITGDVRLTENYNGSFRSELFNGINAKPSEFRLELNPDVQYFISDRLAIMASPLWNRLWNGNRTNRERGLSLGIAPYCQVGKHLFFVPRFSYALEWEKNSHYVEQRLPVPAGGVLVIAVDTLEHSTKIREREGHFELALMYIANGNFIGTAGTTYSWHRRWIVGDSHSETTNLQLEWFIDVEFFIAPNISFSNRLSYRKLYRPFDNKLTWSFPDDRSMRQFNSSFAIRYYFFNEN